MNINLILYDATPFCAPFEKIKDEFHYFKQISNCFTTTSIASMLTGKMPSDLESGGIGYETESKYKKNGKICWPWEDQLLFSILQERGWNVNIYTDNKFFESVISQRFKINYENIDSEETIKKIQEQKIGNNINFILYNTYHDAISGKITCEEAKQKINNSLELWNFNQEDTIFWIFADHGDFTKITEKISPVGYMTWAILKDNTKNPIFPKTKLISIRDFFPTILEKLKISINDDTIKKETRSVTRDFEKERVYFVEDGRSHVDAYGSSAASAITIEGLSDTGEILNMSQINCYKHKKSEAVVENYTQLKILKKILKERFSWL